MFRRGNAPFHLLVAGAFLFLTLPRIAQPGMFLDGVTYASISRNLAEGIGSFWSPSYTRTLYPAFHEHPPLGFALQAVAFAAFGDHLAVERIYTVLMGALTGVLIALTWRAATRDDGFDWLPIVFWLLPSTVTWAIINNLLETTQAAFTTLAVLAFVRALRSDRQYLPWSGAAGVAIIAAVLTKGPTGLFPLASPVVAAVAFPNERARSIRIGGTMLATVVVLLACVLAADTPRAALAAYLDQQVLASISGARGGGRWSSLVGHLTGGVILRMALLMAIAWLIARAKGRMGASPAGSFLPRWSFFFTIMGVCGSVPTAASARIMGHYLVPSIPMFALGFAAISLHVLHMALTPWSQPASIARKVAVVSGGALAVLAIALPALGITMETRDARWISEYRTLAPHMPHGVTAGTCPAAEGDWGSHAYLQRFFGISLDVDGGREHEHFIQFLDRPCPSPPLCHVAASTSRIALLDCAIALR